MSRTNANKSNGLKQPKEEINIKYMHRPPTITPNYGNQNRSLLPKSKVSRVLLYDNATQEHMLDIKLAHISIEKERICRLINLHKRSFHSRMMKKQHMMKALLTGSKQKETQPTETREINNLVTLPVENTEQPLEDSDVDNGQETGNDVSYSRQVTDVNITDLKLPTIETDKRHVIFRIKGKTGKTELYHTIDESGVLSDLIPMHSKLTDDPRFKSLQNLLVPSEAETLDF
ncbi:hypothetical protein ACF0H5_015433 [Mactra antiquata]